MKKRFTILIAALAAILMMAQPMKVMGQTTTFASGSGSSGYTVPDGWTVSGTVEGGSYLKFDNGTLTSPEFAPHNAISFTYTVATLNSGTNHPLTIRILNASTNVVIIEKTTATPTSSSNYISTDSPLSIGDVSVPFKIQLYAPSAKGIRLRNYSITGTPAAEPDTYTITYKAGEGEGDDVIETKTENVNYIIKGQPNSFTAPEGAVFVGWIDDDTNPYDEGDIYTTNGELTLTAQWSTTAAIHTFNFAGANNFYTNSTLTTHPGTGSSNNVGTIYYGDGSTFVASGNSRYFSSSSTGYFMLGTTNATISLPQFNGYKITKVKIHSSSSHSTNVAVSIVNGSNTASSAQTWSNRDKTYNYIISADYQSLPLSVKVTNGYNSQFTSITIICEEKLPEISADNPDALESDATGGSITYSITNGEENAVATVSVGAYNIADFAITTGGVTPTSVPFTCSANNTYTAHTASVTLSYTKEGHDPVSTSVTVTQNAKTASVTLNKNAVDVDYASQELQDINVATNMTVSSKDNFEVYFYSSANAANDAFLTSGNEPGWIAAEVVYNEGTSQYQVYYTINSNSEGVTRYAYFRVYAMDDDLEHDAYSATVTVTQTPVAQPTFDPVSGSTISSDATIAISCDTPNTTIEYSLDDGANWNSYNAPITAVASIKARAKTTTGNVTSAVATATYTVVTALGDMDAIFAKAEEVDDEETPVYITFNNWVISGASSRRAYVTDGTKGFPIYSSSNDLNFEAGQILNGTKYCTIVLSHGAVQITGLNKNDFTYTMGDVPEPTEIAIADLGAINTGMVVDLGLLTYDGTYFVCDEDNKVKPYEGLSTLGSYVTDARYYVKGVFTYYDEKEILPRDASDIYRPKHAFALYSTPINGTVSFEPASPVSEGATVTLTETPDVLYAFDRWTFYKKNNNDEFVVDNSIAVTDNTFTMPTYDLWVAATFTAQSVYTLTFNVNGSDVMTATVAQNGTLDLSKYTAPVTSDTYTFAGWCTNPSANPITLLPSSYKPSDNVTLYPVYSEGISGYLLIEDVDDIDEGTYLIGTHTSDNSNFNISTGEINNSNDLCITSSTFTLPESNAFSSIPEGGVEFEFAGNSTDGFTISYDDNYLGYTSINTNRRLAWDEDYSDITWKFYINSDDEYYIQTQYSTSYYTISANGGTPGGIRGYSGSTVYNSLYFFKKVEGNYHTDINIPATTTVTNIANNTKVIVKDGQVLTLTGANNGTAANLIIEDGGQIITSRTDVKATFKKTIEETTKGSNWNTISSPIGSVEISTVPNLVSGEGLTYNLYRYNETKASNQWEAYNLDNTSASYHSDFTHLEKGHGYLYRNNGHDIEYAGTVNTENVELTLTASATALTNLKGFNLIGNPFGQNITMSNISGVSLSGGYVLSNAGGWSPDPVATIHPCEGFLVQVAEETDITITLGTKGTTYNREYIKLTVSNSQYEDAAYALFDNSYGLNKIEHRNPEIPMIYINKDNRDLAIATMSDNTKSFNLNFKAMTTGKYTLSYKATGEYNYLHVIDRITGADVDMLLDGEYSFIGTPSDNENRFIVRLEYMPNYSEDTDEIFAIQNGNEILVSGEGELQIFDITGRSVMITTISGAESINLSTQGVYIFRLVGSEIKTQKIVVR